MELPFYNLKMYPKSGAFSNGFTRLDDPACNPATATNRRRNGPSCACQIGQREQFSIWSLSQRFRIGSCDSPDAAERSDFGGHSGRCFQLWRHGPLCRPVIGTFQSIERQLVFDRRHSDLYVGSSPQSPPPPSHYPQQPIWFVGLRGGFRPGYCHRQPVVATRANLRQPVNKKTTKNWRRKRWTFSVTHFVAPFHPHTFKTKTNPFEAIHPSSIAKINRTKEKKVFVEFFGRANISFFLLLLLGYLLFVSLLLIVWLFYFIFPPKKLCIISFSFTLSTLYWLLFVLFFKRICFFSFSVVQAPAPTSFCQPAWRNECCVHHRLCWLPLEWLSIHCRCRRFSLSFYSSINIFLFIFSFFVNFALYVF